MRYLIDYMQEYVVVKRKDYLLNHWVLFIGGLVLGLLFRWN